MISMPRDKTNSNINNQNKKKKKKKNRHHHINNSNDDTYSWGRPGVVAYYHCYCVSLLLLS